MNNASPIKLPPGDSDATEIYLAVGSALSYWEAAEDALLDVFAALAGDFEPVAMESYEAAVRSRRLMMLRYAIKRYGDCLAPAHTDRLLAAVEGLDRLAKTRNEIAHGYCVHLNETVDGEMVAKGHYLLPTLSEGRSFFRRSRKYAHTAKDIVDFREEVRGHRWEVVQILGELINLPRHQNRHQNRELFERFLPSDRKGPK